MALPFAIWMISTLIFGLVSWDRLLTPSADNHFVHLADSFLNGQLHQEGNPPGQNDWACFDTEKKAPCPMNRFSFPTSQQERYRWYVSFPPFPSVVLLPVVAMFGLDTLDRLVWVFVAGLAPMFLFLLLQLLAEKKYSTLSRNENLLLSAMFAFGSVFFFVAVQGAVWFSAQVVASSLLCLYLYFGLEARKPIFAGIALGCCFLTRPTTAMLAIFFGIEAMRMYRREQEATLDDDAPAIARFRQFISGADWAAVLKNVALFSVPILCVGGLAMWMNQVRFSDPFEFGHSFLQIRWRIRIERWGLFNYHYFAKNLSIFLASLPWLSVEFPYLKVSRHGLALWMTTPALLWLLWPQRDSKLRYGLVIAAVPVLILNLMYQNSGWMQFGYRFALDYLPFLVVLLAVSRISLSKTLRVAVVLGICVSAFGAVTFDRMPLFYDNDASQETVFQPDD